MALHRRDPRPSPDQPRVTADREHHILALVVSREALLLPGRPWGIGRYRLRVRPEEGQGLTVGMVVVAGDDIFSSVCNAVTNKHPPVPMPGAGGCITGDGGYSLRPNARRSYCSLA